MILKHESVLTVVLYLHETPKLLAIAHENGLKKQKTTSFCYNSNIYLVLWATQIPMESKTRKKTAIRHENDKFLVVNLKYVSGLVVVENRTRTPNPWASS